MTVVVEGDEWDVLQNWKRSGSSFVLVRLKAEAVMLAAEGVSVEVISRFVDRTSATVRGWLRGWRSARLGSVVTGHAGNENAAKLTAAQKREVKGVLESPPSKAGVPAAFWDVPALKALVSARFSVEYESESSLHLLMRFCGMSFKYPDAFDKRRDEKMIVRRMGEIREQVAGLLEAGVEVFAADEVRVEHEAETRRMWLPVGVRTKLRVDRERAAQSYFGALNLATGKVHLERIDGQQNTEQAIQVLSRFHRACSGRPVAVVWDNASWHRSKELRALFGPGQVFENITLIHLPPYAPDHNPVEHVWNHAKGAIANLQRDEPALTFSAFEDYIRSREFRYDFENLPTSKDQTDLV